MDGWIPWTGRSFRWRPCYVELPHEAAKSGGSQAERRERRQISLAALGLAAGGHSLCCPWMGLLVCEQFESGATRLGARLPLLAALNFCFAIASLSAHRSRQGRARLPLESSLRRRPRSQDLVEEPSARGY